jgi:hypothetical protein
MLLVLLALGISTSTLASQSDMRTEVLEDGVLFITNGSNGASTLTLRGPGDYNARMNFAAGRNAFVDIANVNGKALSDGFYKYEIVFSPRQAARLASGADRNAFSGVTAAKSSPVSGNFRIVDGLVVDPYLEETKGK